MDDLGSLIFVGIAIAAAVFVAWVVLALFMRMLALFVFYWIVSFSVGLIAGLIAGLLIPLRVLSGKASVKPAIATPDKVVDNKVMRIPPRGMQKHFGWDRAWPVYNPYQARLDALAVTAETRLLLRAVWTRTRPANLASAMKVGKSKGSAPSGSKGVASAATTTIPGLLWILFAAVPTAGFFVATWVSIAFWLIAMLVFGGAVYLIQVVWVTLYRWSEKLGRRRAKASLKCHVCYRETDTPSFKCKNPICEVIHRDISPGPLGMIRRRCACRTSLPTTVGKAAKVLDAVCPFCDSALAEGAGTRYTIQIPTIGSVGAGKTRLFAASTAALAAHVKTRGGEIVPLSPASTDFLAAAKDVVKTSQKTAKTPVRAQPEGLPYRLDVNGRTIEIQMMDAAGESFTNMDMTQSLHYMDSAGVLLVVLDPLAFENIREEVQRSGGARRVEIAVGDQEDAYASVVDRLRAENVDLRRRNLAVVLTKIDVLQSLTAGRELTPGNSAGIRQWLNGHGEDGLVRRIEDDFEKVTYFAVDSMSSLALDDPRNPVAVLQWVLDVSNTKISLLATSVASPS